MMKPLSSFTILPSGEHVKGDPLFAKRVSYSHGEDFPRLPLNGALNPPARRYGSKKGKSAQVVGMAKTDCEARDYDTPFYLALRHLRTHCRT